jgi:hypothetical protein
MGQDTIKLEHPTDPDLAHLWWRSAVFRPEGHCSEFVRVITSVIEVIAGMRLIPKSSSSDEITAENQRPKSARCLDWELWHVE